MFIINKSLNDDKLYLLVNLTNIQKERDYKGSLRVLGSKVKPLHTAYPWVKCGSGNP